MRRKIGFLPEHFRFYDWLTSGELLELHGRLNGMTSARLRERVPVMLEMVGLAPHRDKRVRDFSKGMMQRIGLAQALIHEPEIVFLDEPTSGLDPMGRRLVRDVIRAQRERGATVFLNSHLLERSGNHLRQSGFPEGWRGRGQPGFAEVRAERSARGGASKEIDAGMRERAGRVGNFGRL